ncbi:MAG: Mfa1 family fimbria major subunit [Tannerellaceae bacterium]|nr:Mfa1 family fimbria major subunit [Tannerellaceae bacterium]
MTFKGFVYIIIGVYGMMACVKEVVDDNPVEISPEDAKIRIALKANEFSTKGAGDHYSTALLPEEKRVFNYAIFIFNSDYQLEASLTATPYDPDRKPGSAPLTYEAPLTFTDDRGEEIEVVLTSGQKYLFALVNAPLPLLEEQNRLLANPATTLSDLNNWVLNVHADLGLITGSTATPKGEERGYLMTSGNGVESVFLEPVFGDAASISLSVGRAMAKVSVASDLAANPRSLTQQPNGELTDITYKIINNPQEIYVVPSIISNVLYTPWYYGAKGSYFDSPGLLADNYVPISRKGALTQIYCMENANQTPNSGNSTMAVIKGIYTPDVLYRADGSTLFTGYQKGNHFWRIANVTNGVITSYEDKYYGENPSQLLTQGQEAIKYTNGETYYLIYLRNTSSAAPYTVKRNSYYNIDITSVSNAGSGSIDTTDPEDPGPGGPGEPGGPGNPGPVDSDGIKVTIQVVDWESVNQGGNLY